MFFVTGSAGTGKSYVLLTVEMGLNERRIKFIKLAPTGIAAINIEGETIHSALAIRASTYGKSTSFMTSMHQSEDKAAELRSVEVIMIDEISMVSSELLNFMSAQFAKLHRNGRPFGGIVVIVFGDLLQLPPVTGQSVYRSNLWTLFFPLFLKISHRHSEDSTFAELLNEVRTGNISDQSWELLEGLQRSFSMTANLWKSTFIVALRSTARSINNFIAQSLDLIPLIHYAVDCEGDRILTIAETIKPFKSCTNLPEELNLCVGGRVMFLDNSLINLGISNGSTGVVMDMEKPMGERVGRPTVAFPTTYGIRV